MLDVLTLKKPTISEKGANTASNAIRYIRKKYSC